MLVFGLSLLLLLFLLPWSGRLSWAKEELDVNLQPGHVKQDYDSMEEVMGHDNETETEKPAEDEHLMREAILDVAYYLRRFKFSGYDPRHFTPGYQPPRNLFVQFPSPPLDNIHWEVKKNCEPSFVECVKYLHEQVSQTALPRHLDSLTITKQNGWSFITDRDLIKAADDECVKLLQEDEENVEVFFGPLQRFRWLTSASYYMCFYTMRETSYLKTFTEDCDNYASCMEWDLGYSNKDVRSDNSQPFACAFYSFCPDPCCPLKYLPEWSTCAQYSPCSLDAFAGNSCSFSRKANAHFDSLLSNRWNISCKCEQPGMRWESKSGMCVDIDECVEMESACEYPSETCMNLPGSYACVCSPLGYRINPDSNSCVEDPILREIFYPPRTVPLNDSIPLSVRFSDRIRSFALTVKSFWLAAVARYRAQRNRQADCSRLNDTICQEPVEYNSGN